MPGQAADSIGAVNVNVISDNLIKSYMLRILNTGTVYTFKNQTWIKYLELFPVQAPVLLMI